MKSLLRSIARDFARRNPRLAKACYVVFGTLGLTAFIIVLNVMIVAVAG